MKTKLAIIPLLALFCFITHILNVTCIIKKVFGIACLGCGMTRAVIYAIKLDFANAFTLHPMFWSLPVLFLYFLYDGHLFNNKKANFAILAVIALGFLLNWLVRQFL